MSHLYPREVLDSWFAEAGTGLVDRATLVALADTVFFASLMHEEGAPVQISIVYAQGGSARLAAVFDDAESEDPPLAWDVTQFHRRALTAPALAKVSRGATYGTQMIVVGGDANELWIDGIARRRRNTDGGDVLRIAAPRPGILVFEHHFRQLLRLEAGARVDSGFDVIGADGPVRDAIGRITGHRGSHNIPGGSALYSFFESALRRLVGRMRGTDAGAILILSPVAPDEAVLSEVTYRRVDPSAFSKTIEERDALWFAWINTYLTMEDEPDATRSEKRDATRAAHEAAEQALDAAIDDLARLSAVDGAVLAGPGLTVYGAGYLIPTGTSERSLVPVRACDLGGIRTEPYVRQHGARHRAAYAYVFDHPGAVAFVVSEDGPVKCALKIENQLVVWSVSVSET